MDICRLVCWGAAFALAALAGWAVASVIGMSFYVALIIGVLVFIMLAWALPLIVCGEEEHVSVPEIAPITAPVPAPETKSVAAQAAPAAAAAAPVSEQAVEAPATAAHWSGAVDGNSGKASAGRGQSALKPAVAPSEEDTLRDGVGAWRYESDPAAAAPVTPAKPAPVTETASDAEAAPAEAKPETLSGARAGGADDLKRIKGVGPGLEKTLNDLGFYHFDQIAAWTGSEVEWVDARLKFKGRIVRDNWIDQAKAFAAEA